MNKARIVSIIAIGAAMLLAGCSDGTLKQETVVKIGHIAVLTGDHASRGQAEKNALELAVEKVNRTGGITGKKVRLVSCDTQGNVGKTVAAAKHLISQERVVAIIGSGQNAATIATALVAEQESVPFFATAATNARVTMDLETGKVRQFVFQSGLIDSFQANVAARFAVQELKAKTAAVVYDAGAAASSMLAKVFVTRFVELGGKVLANEAFQSKDTEFRPILEKVNEDRPAVLFAPIPYKAAALLAKQAQDMGLAIRLIGGADWKNPDLIVLGGTAVEGSFLVVQTGLEDPAVKPFVAEFKSRYGQDPELPDSLLAVDALLLLVETMKALQSADPIKIAGRLKTMPGVSVLGGNVRMDPGTHSLSGKMASIQEIKGGKFIHRTKLAGN